MKIITKSILVYYLILMVAFSCNGCSNISSNDSETSTESDTTVCMPPYVQIFKKNYEKDIDFFRKHGTLFENFIEYEALREFGEYNLLGLQGPTREQIDQIPIVNGIRNVPAYLLGKEHYVYNFIIPGPDKEEIYYEEELYYSVDFRVAHLEDFPLDLIGVFSVLVEPKNKNHLITDKGEINANMMTLKNYYDCAYYIEENVLYNYEDSKLKSVSVDIGNRIITIGYARIAIKISDESSQPYETTWRFPDRVCLDKILDNNIYSKIFSSMNSTDIYNNLMDVLSLTEESTS